MQLKQFTRTQMTKILTTNRTDSLQYTALIAAYKACPSTGLDLGTSRSLCQCVIQCAIVPPKLQQLRCNELLAEYATRRQRKQYADTNVIVNSEFLKFCSKA